MLMPAVSQRELNQFTGSEQFYKHWTGAIVYTQGIQFLAEKMGAYWLIDVVASYQPTLNEAFQVWTLRKTEAAYEVICESGEDNIIVRQEIPFTDFHEGLMPFKVLLFDQTLMLPSEY